MVKHVCARTNLTRNEAYMLCSLAGNLPRDSARRRQQEDSYASAKIVPVMEEQVSAARVTGALPPHTAKAFVLS